VPILSPVSVAETALSVVSKPADWGAVFEPYAVLVPYSNHTVEARPRGLIVPVTTAVVAVTDWAGPVLTEGAASVVKVRSAPRVVPALLEPTSLKW